MPIIFPAYDGRDSYPPLNQVDPNEPRPTTSGQQRHHIIPIGTMYTTVVNYFNNITDENTQRHELISFLNNLHSSKQYYINGIAFGNPQPPFNATNILNWAQNEAGYSTLCTLFKWLPGNIVIWDKGSIPDHGNVFDTDTLGKRTDISSNLFDPYKSNPTLASVPPINPTLLMQLASKAMKKV